MKNSKEYSKKLRKLFSSLKREYPKPEKIVYDEPLDALVYAIVGENMSESATQSAMKKLADNFVDLNDLRVSSTEEIVEVLGADTSAIRDMALALTRVLRAVFNGCNMVSLKALKKIGKRPAKQTLEQINGINHFVIDYCMLTSLQAHAIPLTEKMIELLRISQVVHPDADEQEIKGFLARQISADRAYEFYALLRCESEARQPKIREKRKTARKAKSKTTTRTKRKAKK